MNPISMRHPIDLSPNLNVVSDPFEILFITLSKTCSAHLEILSVVFELTGQLFFLPSIAAFPRSCSAAHCLQDRLGINYMI